MGLTLRMEPLSFLALSRLTVLHNPLTNTMTRENICEFFD